MKAESKKENTYTAIWRRNFMHEVEAIQIEYDAFFTNRKLQDYFSLTEDESTDTLSLHFHDAQSLPKSIEKSLQLVFLKSKPDYKINSSL